MLLLTLPTHRRLTFYLAAEEWAALRLLDRADGNDIFFAWRVAPTVIYGRHQDPQFELDYQYCRQHGIDTVRRKSGGGCVYADMDNVMFSYITAHKQDIPGLFADYTRRVADMLRSLGLNAEAGGRNDITIDGQKVSGNSFYRLHGRSIVHGTMLFNTDFDNMSRAITPARAKMQSKKVLSVNARITTLAQKLPQYTIQQFIDYAINYLSIGNQYVPTATEIAEIEAIEREYAATAQHDADAYSAAAAQTAAPNSVYLPNIGMVTPTVIRDAHGKVIDLKITGDFFSLSDDPGSELLQCLKTGSDPSAVVANMTTEALKALLNV